MPDEPETFFETLEPPLGGVAGLRRRLQREPRRRRRRATALALAVAAAVVVLLLVVRGRVARFHGPPVADFDPALVSLGLQNVPAEPATIPPDMRQRMALQRVPLKTDGVIFYYVAVLPSASDSDDER
jgi:hypothetical protein